MSLDIFWETVDLFRKKESFEKQDVIDLEHAFQNILNHHKTNECHKHLGYSQSFPRYLEKMSDASNPTILKDLKQHMYAREHQLYGLRKIISKRREAIETICDHKWQYDTTERDERSRYTCVKCNAFR
tara:strand:- start:919 stop:1302 length:384 start_codon:yes stop_codon:yes gene_type:complete